MPQLVQVASVQQLESLKTYVNELFEKNRFSEISQAVGMHSILVDPEHMIRDQEQLYRLVLNLLKKKVASEVPHTYAAWMNAFPSLLASISEGKQPAPDASAQAVLASYHAAYGLFTSLDSFYFWALDDRRLPLDQIVLTIRKTVDMHKR